MSKKFSRWIPALAVPAAIVAAGAVVVPMTASAAPNLPEKTPAEVLALVAASDVGAYSGEVTLSSDLGLPSMPSLPAPEPHGGSGDGADAASSVLALLSGSHDLRVYRDGQDARVQVLDELAERDLVVDGDGASVDVWLYDSEENAAVHVTGTAPEHAAPGTTARESSVTPDELATRIVTALEPSSTLSVDTAQRVAGREAYTLVLEPKASGTLVGDVSIAVDAETGLPLSVSATPRGADDAAVAVSFTSIDFAAPPADLFDFTAPKDADVTEKSLGALGGADKPDKPDLSGLPEPTVSGDGWDAIVTLDTGSELTDVTSSPLFTQLAAPVEGGYLLHTSLVNVLVTDDGRVLAGSVPADALAAAAK